MTRRLVIVVLIPVLGLLLLLAGLAVVGDKATSVDYAGRTWTGGTVEACPARATPAVDTIRGQQVLTGPGVLVLLRPDGSCTVYREAP